MTKIAKSEISIFVALFLIAFLIRAATAVAVGISHKPESDEVEFFEPAESFSKGEGLLLVPRQSPDGVAHPSAFRMPLPSMLMGMGMALFGQKYMVARLASMVFGSFAAPLMYSFVRRFASQPPALIAGLGVILHPVLVFNTVALMSEPFFVPALLLALILTLQATDSRTSLSGLWAGLAWGLAIMIKPHAAPMAFLIMLYLFARSSWKVATCLAAGVVIVLVPWVIRNTVTLGYPVLFATEGGETFLGANNPYVLEDPDTWGMWRGPISIEEYRVRLLPIRGEVERNKEQFAIAMEYLKANPGIILKLVSRKLLRWFNPITDTAGAIRFVVLGSYGALVLLLAIGAFRGTYQSSVALHIVLLCSLVLVAITAVFWGTLTRGRIPLEVLWIPWAAITVWNLIHPRFTQKFKAYLPASGNHEAVTVNRSMRWMSK